MRAARPVTRPAGWTAGPRSVHGLAVTDSWTRKWAAVPPAVVHSFGAAGTATANSPTFDWGWLIGSGLDPRRPPAAVFDVDGGTRGMPAANFLFRCFRAGSVVRCRNALGDELRYSPLSR
jgi:hypothetical protein